MPAPTFDSLHRSLKNGEFSPVYYFFGEEEILKDEAMRTIVDRVLDPSLRDFNYDQRSVSQLDAEALHSLLNTLPMMADRRVVILRDLEALKRKTKVKAVLEGYLAKPSPDTVLVLVQSSADPKVDPAMARNSMAIEFTPLPPDRAMRWIVHHAGKLGLTLTSEATSHLFEAIGNDLGTLRMELDKIASLAVDGAVGIDQVANLVGVRRGETLVSWRDLVMEGSTARALPMTARVLEQSGMSGVKMVAALGAALTGMGLTRAIFERNPNPRGLQQKVMSTLLSIRPYGLPDWKMEAEKWARWAPGWTEAHVRDGLRAAMAADRALKNTRISDDCGVVTDLVLQLTEHRWGEAA
ncbi:MAG: DNA polymerase III subunit delta [Gemmatimonadota bacterium]